MTPVQLESLATLDAHTDGPNAIGDRTVWEESALYFHPFWGEIRKLAIQALKAFGWPEEKPPTYTHEYVPGRPRFLS